MSARATLVAPVLVALALAACSGQVGTAVDDAPVAGAGGGGATRPPGAGGTTPPTATPPGETPAVSGAGAGGLRRLTNAQYRNSVRDLLGQAIVVSTTLEPDGAVEGSTALGAAALAPSRAALEKYEASALDIARQVFADAANRTKVTGCAPAGPADEACARAFVRAFGARAWRRPLGDDEVQAYVTLAAAVGKDAADGWLGLEMALAALLQSPAFVYRVELGRPEAGRTDRLRLDDHELATRLSYDLLDTTPSDALLETARKGGLSTVAGLQAEAQRMLADPRAKTALTAFFVEMLRVGELPRMQKDRAVYPKMSPTLGASMAAELERLWMAFAFTGQGSVLDLYDTRDAFVNAELAGLYGLPAPRAGETAAATHPPSGPRAGLLTTAGFLAQNALIDHTSPTARGKTVRENLLCTDIPMPPGNVVTELPPLPAGQKQTMRERLAKHATDPGCAGCHALMDPIGLALEHFDGIGVYRTTDGGLPIDGSGTLDGVAFKTAAELASALRRHPAAAGCLTRHVYRFLTGVRESTATSTEALLDGVTRGFQAKGERFTALVLELIGSDAFRYAATVR